VQISGRILLIEDEAALRMTLGDRLAKEGYIVDATGTGEDGLRRAAIDPFDLILLDERLPDVDGFAVCRKLRSDGVSTPVLMLTARDRTRDKVAGFRLGADDYVTKPFKMPELLARIGALLRRTSDRAADAAPARHEFGDVRVDVRATEVVRHGEPVSLSLREFALLQFFLEHPGATLSRTDLLTRVWGYHASMFTRTVDVHVASLRQKLEDDPRHPRHFLTVQRLGYKFKP
jgi:two-component system alkaline phosphatase synthesis response regulator PhoP